MAIQLTPVQRIPARAVTAVAPHVACDTTAVSVKPSKTWFNRARAIIGLSVIAPFAMAAALSHLHFAAGSWGTSSLRTLAWLLFLAGAALRFWATLYIGGRKGYELADEGPYSVVRNPLYLGTFLITISIAAFMQSLTLAAGMLLATSIYALATLPNEEQRLRANLGAAYEQYFRRVPRIIPNLSLWKTRQYVEVNMHGVTKELRRASAWIWAPIVCELVLMLRHAPGWPALFWLP